MSTCLNCGREFTHGEKRYGEHAYRGYYCPDHDSVEDDPA